MVTPTRSASLLIITLAVFLILAVESQAHAKLTPAQKANAALLKLWDVVNMPKDTVAKVESLVAKGANVNAKDMDGNTALMLAIDVDDQSSVRFLIAHGADMNAERPGQNGRSILEDALINEKFAIVKMLVAAGANVNTTYPPGHYSPLIAACDIDNLECARILVLHGAKVNIITDVGDSPLFSACRAGNLGLVRFLIAKGAQVNLKDAHGFTALLVASECGQLSCVSYLISRGAQVNVRDSDGESPLMLAIDSNRTATVKLLIAYGADVNNVDTSGKSVLDWAQHEPANQQIVAIVKKAGAK